MGEPVEGVEVWRGGVAAWECDAAGRLSVRFQLARAMEGLAGLAAELGLTNAFAPSGVSTLIVREHHLRVLGEACAGDGLSMTAGLCAFEEAEAVAVQTLRRADTGEPVSAYLTRVAHVTGREARPFPWSARTCAAAEALMADAPELARPQGLPGGPVAVGACRAAAEALGVPVLGRGVVRPDECDVFGRVRPDALLGRCEDAAPKLFASAPKASKGGKPGVATLEARILYPRPASAGARLELRCGLAEVSAGVERHVWWVINPDDGLPYASAQALVGASEPGGPKPRPGSKTAAAVPERSLVPGMEF